MEMEAVLLTSLNSNSYTFFIVCLEREICDCCSYAELLIISVNYLHFWDFRGVCLLMCSGLCEFSLVFGKQKWIYN